MLATIFRYIAGVAALPIALLVLISIVAAASGWEPAAWLLMLLLSPLLWLFAMIRMGVTTYRKAANLAEGERFVVRAMVLSSILWAPTFTAGVIGVVLQIWSGEAGLR